MQMKSHKQNPGSCSELPWNKSGVTALELGNDSNFYVAVAKRRAWPHEYFQMCSYKVCSVLLII